MDLKRGETLVTEGVVRSVIRRYMRNAGVRSLERKISKICRKVMTALAQKKHEGTVEIIGDHIGNFLCARDFNVGQAEKRTQIRQGKGLAWAEVGGDSLTIEAIVMTDKGNIIRTGSLGDVMKESVEAARTVMRSRAARLGLTEGLFEKRDIHMPDGSTPKDGPSAGAAMMLAFVSAPTGIPVRPTSPSPVKSPCAAKLPGSPRT